GGRLLWRSRRRRRLRRRGGLLARGAGLSLGRRRLGSVAGLPERGEIPHAVCVLDQLDAGTCQGERVYFHRFMQERKQFDGNIQFLRLNKWLPVIERWIICNCDVLHAKSRWKDLQVHLSQCDLQSESLLYIGLDSSAITVYIERSRKDHHSHNHNQNDDTNGDAYFLHNAPGNKPLPGFEKP